VYRPVGIYYVIPVAALAVFTGVGVSLLAGSSQARWSGVRRSRVPPEVSFAAGVRGHLTEGAVRMSLRAASVRLPDRDG
jgi:hypothetical protein